MTKSTFGISSPLEATSVQMRIAGSFVVLKADRVAMRTFWGREPWSLWIVTKLDGSEIVGANAAVSLVRLDLLVCFGAELELESPLVVVVGFLESLSLFLEKSSK